MNILVLGNGFDLAHGLPTAYPDFLAFCRMISAVYYVDGKKNADKVWENLNINLKRKENVERLRLKFSELYSVGVCENHEKRGRIIRTNTVYDELYDNIENNIWIDYFLDVPMYRKDNWIDFEGEISKVIQIIDESLEQRELDLEIKSTQISYFDNRILEKKTIISSSGMPKTTRKRVTYRELRDRLYIDLNKLIRAFEIYLCEYVQKIESKLYSVDIENVYYDSVISFNYTNTYQRIYDEDMLSKYDYVHGQALEENSIITNNMVLGIDEYLPEERRNRDVEFIAFKKYYQRIFKETGCKYKEWVDEIKSDRSIMNGRLVSRSDGTKTVDYVAAFRHNLYIYGHSLDSTDGDILRQLILNNRVNTTIFYYDRDDFGKKIANLVRVIGQDELIKRTGGRTKTIEFKLQSEMLTRE